MSDVYNNNSYHGFSKFLHWITALIILGLLPVGFYMTLMGFSESKFALYGLHKSFGLLVLILACVRVVSWFCISKPAHLDTHAIWEKIAAKVAHLILYVSLFAMPLSGWVMSSAGDFPVSFFGFPVPDVMEKNETVFKLSRQIHEFSSYALIAVIGMHVLGALKHHFIDRDTTLRRMIRLSAHIGEVMCVVVMFGVLYTATLVFGGQYVQKHYSAYFSNAVERSDVTKAEQAVPVQSDVHADSESAFRIQEWAMDSKKSSISFTATQYGQEFSGNFELFEADIQFDPSDLQASRVRVTIDISSIGTGSEDRDRQAISDEWFDVMQYPSAFYSADHFEHIGDSRYIAKGHLDLRGVRLPVEFPFDLKFRETDDGKDTADMKASLTLNRLDFGVGQGTWSSTDAIGGDIKVEINVIAHVL